jgi:hypothetical protein
VSVRAWLATLPLVYDELSSAYLEEVLVLHIAFVSAALARTTGHHLLFLRARICLCQLEEVATTTIARLEDLQTVLHGVA